MGFQSVEGRGAIQLLRDESQDSCATCLDSIARGHYRREQHNGRLNGREPYATACDINEGRTLKALIRPVAQTKLAEGCSSRINDAETDQDHPIAYRIRRKRIGV